MAQNSQGQYVNENNLDSLLPATGQDRNILQMQYSININSVNPYCFMDDTFHGSGGYRDGSYLIPFSRESSFLQRKQLAHFKNYLKPILRAMVEPVFTQTAVRTVKDDAGQPIENSLFTEFLEDCDSAETFIQDFSHQVVALARRHGVAFAVMDNYPTTTQPSTVSEALDGRIYPYVYAKRANEVEDYEVDPFGNLVEITFTDASVKVNYNGSTITEKRWRRWTQTESIVLSKNKSNSKEFVEVSRATHNLGVVPVVMVFSDARDCNTKVMVDPPLYDIAKLNYVIFNQSAEIRDQERAQAFSIFYCQGVPPADLVISNNTYINLPESATIPPGYASPDWNIVTGLVANQEQIKKDLYQIAEQNGVVGIESETSGIAKAFDFEARESVLKWTARMATDLENKLSELFQQYTNEKFVYTVVYVSDFAPTGLDDEVDRYEKLLKLPGLNSVFAAKIQEKLARLLLRDEDDKTIQEIVDAIEAGAVVAQEAPGNVEPEEASIKETKTPETPTPGPVEPDSNGIVLPPEVNSGKQN